MITFQQLLSESMSTAPKVSYLEKGNRGERSRYLFVVGTFVYVVYMEDRARNDDEHFVVDFGVFNTELTPEKAANLTSTDLKYNFTIPSFRVTGYNNPHLVLSGVIHGIKTLLRALNAKVGDELVAISTPEKTQLYRAIAQGFIKRGWAIEVDPNPTNNATLARHRASLIRFKLLKSGAEML